MKLEKYYKVIENTPKEVTEDIKLSMQIMERIHYLLELKFDGKQKLLAEKMGKSEAEISKLLSGLQNYTTKTLIKFQLAFGQPIIQVCFNRENMAMPAISSGRQIESKSSAGTLYKPEYKKHEAQKISIDDYFYPNKKINVA